MFQKTAIERASAGFSETQMAKPSNFSWLVPRIDECLLKQGNTKPFRCLGLAPIFWKPPLREVVELKTVPKNGPLVSVMPPQH